MKFTPPGEDYYAPPILRWPLRGLLDLVRPRELAMIDQKRRRPVANCCVPLVNLFETNADPIVLTPYVTEHDVVPDAQRPLDLEVYEVQEVVGLSADGERTPYAPFYSIKHDAPSGPGAYWHTIRRASRKKGDEGTDTIAAW